jgi:hypothetical protein
VLSPNNAKLRVLPSYFLTFGATERLVINDWWGRAGDFAAIVRTDPVPKVTLDFNAWLPHLVRPTP